MGPHGGNYVVEESVGKVICKKIVEAIQKMKLGKATGSSEVIVER